VLSFTTEKRIHGICYVGHCYEEIANVFDRNTGIFGTTACTDHNKQMVDYVYPDYQKKQTYIICHQEGCDRPVQGISPNSFTFMAYCKTHRTAAGKVSLDRERWSLDHMESLAAEYVERYLEILESGKKIFLANLSHQGNLDHLNGHGPYKAIEVEEYIDKEEALAGTSLFLFKLMADFRKLVLNTVGVTRTTSPGKIKLIMAVFDKDTEPWGCKFNTSIMEFKADLEEIWEVARREPGIILRNLEAIREATGEEKLRSFTYGMTFNKTSRAGHYEDFLLYENDDGQESLECEEEKSWCPGDEAAHETFGLYLLRTHPILKHLITNELSGGDNLAKRFPANSKGHCAYSHVLKQGAGKRDANFVRLNLKNPVR
jgi:hypothetical protein